MCYVTHNIIILFQWTIGHESFWWWMSIKNSVKFISRPTCGHVLGFTTTTVCWFFAGLSSGALCFRAQRTTWLATRCRAKRCTSAWITSTMWCFCSGVLKGDIRSGNGTRWVMKDKKKDITSISKQNAGASSMIPCQASHVLRHAAQQSCQRYDDKVVERPPAPATGGNQVTTLSTACHPTTDCPWPPLSMQLSVPWDNAPGASLRLDSLK